MIGSSRALPNHCGTSVPGLSVSKAVFDMTTEILIINGDDLWAILIFHMHN